MVVPLISAGIYFNKECGNGCSLVAELLVEPKDCRLLRLDGRCTDPHGSETKVSIPVTVAPTPWRMEATASKGAGQIDVTVSKDGQPAAGVTAKIIASTEINTNQKIFNVDPNVMVVFFDLVTNFSSPKLGKKPSKSN